MEDFLVRSKNNVSPVGESWSSYRVKHYTPEEIAENNLMVEIVGEIVKVRNEKNISQNKPQEGVNFSVSIEAKSF